MFRRILPSAGVLALGFALFGCTDTGSAVPPPTNATLDTGSHVTGQSGSPQSGGAAATGTRMQPSGAVTTAPQ